MKTFALFVVLMVYSIPAITQETVVQKDRPFMTEWGGGAKWALYSSSGAAAATLLFLVGGEAGGYAGLFLGMASLATMPFFVAAGVNRAGKPFNPNGQYWKAFSGALVGTAAVTAMEIMIFNNRVNSPLGNASGLFIIPGFFAGAFVIIPLASVLTYNLFSPSRPTSESNALLNFQSGKLTLGNPTPVLYSNPQMEGKLCSQISLLKITF